MVACLCNFVCSFSEIIRQRGRQRGLGRGRQRGLGRGRGELVMYDIVCMHASMRVCACIREGGVRDREKREIEETRGRHRMKERIKEYKEREYRQDDNQI